MNLSKAHLVPYQQVPLHVIAETILQQEQASLPDLSSVTVLLEDSKPSVLLRRQLLLDAKRLGYGALLGPNIMSRHDWIMQHCPDNIKICDPHSQRLILVEALKENPALISAANIWSLTDDLLSLFRDLTLNLKQLPEHLNDFTQQLQNAYGLHSSTLDAFGQEALLVFTLWHAWHVQLKAQGLTDTHAAYLLALSNSLQQTPATQKIYIAGFQNPFSCEIEWLKSFTKKLPLQLFFHGQMTEHSKGNHPDSLITNILHQLKLEISTTNITHPITSVLNKVFEIHSDIFLNRCQQTAKQFPISPLNSVIEVFEANSSEEEARAVDVQVRQWLIDGHQKIGIVTENRKLARRVRALLERADIILNDTAGWALSTTSAAASLERWLECIEQDFTYLPLLDLLKSPFAFPEYATETKQHATMRLEQDIIHQENIESNLHRYQLAISDRANRLPHWYSEGIPFLNTLLKELEHAATPLTNLLSTSTTPLKWIEAIFKSLTTLGMIGSFHADQAGARVMQVLEEMQLAARHSALSLDWIGFRTWLGRSLEQTNFQPGRNEHDVHLLNLSQSQLLDFDAIIIASAERDFLPGRSITSAFFNDTVRTELGLTTSIDTIRERLYHFRRLLEAAPHILITSRVEQDGNPIVISPWLEAIQSFHQLSWGESLNAQQLKNNVRQEESRVIRAINKTLPKQSTQPHPSISLNMFDNEFSASGYQQLMNCPYQFFAARCLKLAAKEEISIALSKSDYGKRIHLCLQAFHSDVKDLPGPFTSTITLDNRDGAIQLLSDISDAVFAADVHIRIEHRGWLDQWKKQIPAYIDWQSERQQLWKVHSMESWNEREIYNELKLKGQLDRIDKHQNSLAIIDYKTGSVPKEQDVLQGEAVQLPFYAELALQTDTSVAEVAYLELDNKGKVKMPFCLEGDALQQACKANTNRLTDIVLQLQNGQGLPAWGDKLTCEYCTMNLLCRQQNWINNE